MATARRPGRWHARARAIGRVETCVAGFLAALYSGLLLGGVCRDWGILIIPAVIGALAVPASGWLRVRRPWLWSKNVFGVIPVALACYAVAAWPLTPGWAPVLGVSSVTGFALHGLAWWEKRLLSAPVSVAAATLPRLELKAPNPRPGQCPVCSLEDLDERAADDAFMGDTGTALARVVEYGPDRAHCECAAVVPYLKPPPTPHIGEFVLDGKRTYCGCEKCESRPQPAVIPALPADGGPFTAADLSALGVCLNTPTPDNWRFAGRLITACHPANWRDSRMALDVSLQSWLSGPDLIGEWIAICSPDKVTGRSLVREIVRVQDAVDMTSTQPFSRLRLAAPTLRGWPVDTSVWVCVEHWSQRKAPHVAPNRKALTGKPAARGTLRDAFVRAMAEEAIAAGETLQRELGFQSSVAAQMDAHLTWAGSHAWEQWQRHGFETRAEAATWYRLGFTPQRAQVWRQAGFTDTEAVASTRCALPRELHDRESGR